MAPKWPHEPACPKCSTGMRQLITVYRCPACAYCAPMVTMARDLLHQPLPGALVERASPARAPESVKSPPPTYGLVIPARHPKSSPTLARQLTLADRASKTEAHKDAHQEADHEAHQEERQT